VFGDWGAAVSHRGFVGNLPARTRSGFRQNRILGLATRAVVVRRQPGPVLTIGLNSLSAFCSRLRWSEAVSGLAGRTATQCKPERVTGRHSVAGSTYSGQAGHSPPRSEPHDWQQAHHEGWDAGVAAPFRLIGSVRRMTDMRRIFSAPGRPQRRPTAPMGVHGAQDHSDPNTIDMERFVDNSSLFSPNLSDAERRGRPGIHGDPSLGHAVRNVPITRRRATRSLDERAIRRRSRSSAPGSRSGHG
jgi:hypothetical protein